VLRELLDGSLVPSRRQAAVFAGYLACAGIYIAIGLTELDFLLSFWVAAAYLLLVAWAVPTLALRLFRP
jgi:hypothetical protein